MLQHDLGHTGLSPYDTSANTGSVKSKFTTGGAVHSSPAIGSDGTIYVGSDDDKLYAINPDGTQKCKFTTGDIVESSPSIGTDGTVYIGSSDDNLYAINPDGTKKWNFYTGGAVLSSPAIGSDGTIYVGFAYHPAIGAVHVYGLYAINPDGTKKWEASAIGRFAIFSPAIGSDGVFYVGSSDDNLYAIEPDGTLKWKFTTGGTVVSSAAIDSDGTIYIGSSDNNLYALGSGTAGAHILVSTKPIMLKGKAGHPKSKYLKVKNVGTGPLRVAGTAGLSAPLSSSGAGIIAPKKTLTITVTDSPTKGGSNVTQTLVILSDDPTKPEVDISVTGASP